MRMGFYVGMVVVGLIGMQFTSSKKEKVEAAFGTSDPVSHVETGNAQILAARQQAKASLPEFLSHLRDPQSGETLFTVKFQLTDAGCPVENIWAADLEPMSDGFKATISGAPQCGYHKENDPIVFSNAEVVDWGYMKDGVMQGNYTTKVLIEMMPEAQKTAIREALGWS